MTPPSTAHARSTGHARTPTRRGVSPRGPRRVSGPARPVRTPAGAIALPTPLIARIGQIPESRSLDRLLRSRGWIALLGVLLIGLVFMQVSLLKVNAGMGADVEKAAALERGNSLLAADVSKLESNDRIQGLATRAGMVLPTSDNVRYLGADGKRIGGSQAAANMPSQGEASTAILPTLPADATTEGTTPPPVTPTTTTPEPQTISSVPGAAQPQAPVAETPVTQAQTQAPVTQTQTPVTQTPVTSTATTGSTASTGTTAPPPATATTAAATGAATVGGATPGG